VETTNANARMGAGSCAFDLAMRLGLIPGQPNAYLAIYDEMPIDDVTFRGNCYCGRISRHGLILLISEHLQSISAERDCLSLSTDIGRFKIYEENDETFVHFDGKTRLSAEPLIANQNLDEIMRCARGEYKFRGGQEDVGDVINKLLAASSKEDFAEKEVHCGWGKISEEDLEADTVQSFIESPNAVIYMSNETLRRWKDFEEFASAVVDAVTNVLDDAKEPAAFAAAFAKYPRNPPHGYECKPAECVEETLAQVIFTYKIIQRHQRVNIFPFGRECFLIQIRWYFLN
jgi:hypothetical protein